MKKIFFFLIYLFSFFFIGPIAEAQTGTIAGSITDKATHEAIPVAAVYVDTMIGGTMATIDGSYALRTAPGKHTLIVRFIGYNPKRIPDILVVADSIIKVDVEMESDAKELNTFEIKEIKTTNTENSVISEVRKSDNVVSGISAAQITKSQDRDAAEVVKRIPGVTIIENRFIMVRGLNDRYNTVWLNDASAPSSETDKRSFSFDVIPSGLIDRILVFKTPSPELPGDFAGGMVKVYTRSFPEKSNLSVNYQTSYRPGTTGHPFSSTTGSRTDWLGYDNGYRDIPDGAPEYISKNDPNNSDVSRSFKNTWVINSRSASPDERFNFYVTKSIKRGDIRFGTTTGMFYAHTLSSYNLHRQAWNSTTPVDDYTDIQNISSVRAGVLENVSFSYRNMKFDFKNFLNQLGKDQTVLRNSNLTDAPNEKSYLIGYEERKTISSQFSGSYKSSNEKTGYDFTFGYGKNKKNIPDLRRIKYTKQQTDPDTMYKAGIANVVDPVNGGGRFFSWLSENVHSFSHNFKQKISFSEKLIIEINAGNYVEQKSRHFHARSLGYVIKPSYDAYMLTRLPVDQIFDEANVGTATGFKIDEITSASDAYDAQNKLIATYLSTGWSLGKKIKIVGGARYEYNVMSLQGFVNIDSVRPSVTTKFILPSINTSYNFTDNSLIRAAYGKTLNRPEFREWAPFYFYDFDLRAGTYGSLFPTTLAPNGKVLNTAEINNYDLRYEFYPRNGEMIQLGVFYKSILNPIQQAILPSSGSDNKAYSFINAESAYISGLEVDLRKNLSFADSMFHTKGFSSFNVVGNLSLMKSQLSINDSIFKSTYKSPMQGQSPYVINTGIYYQNDSTHIQVSLLYNVFGPRISYLGNITTPDIGELPKHSLDLTISKTFRKIFVLSVGIQDIFNQPIRLVEDTNQDKKLQKNGDDKPVLTYKRGSYYTIGIGIKL
jgi:outer membrane receptor for ferrienterochelin and colicin